jgi:hypothetical protein
MKRELIKVGGIGYENSQEYGNFVIITDKLRFDIFLLSIAIRVYDSIKENKEIWDLTDEPELLEKHKLLCQN